MRTDANITLEFNKILEHLAGLALSQKAREKLLALRPFLNEGECKAKMRETTEALKIIESVGAPPLAYMKELDKILELAHKGSMLVPEQLAGIAKFISSCRRMKSYLKKAESLEVGLAFYGGSLNELTELFDEIDRAIRNDAVESGASPALRDLRRKIENANSAIKAKLESILHSKKEYFADGYVTTRNGRFVLPVKKQYKNAVSGTVVDTSGTGSTYFIEPAAVRKLQDELASLEIEEDNEVRRILYTLTVLADEHRSALRINMDCMETLDFVFAKAKLSQEMGAAPMPIAAERRIKIVKGRHPLLKKEACVPLDFEIGGDTAGIVITGPNTGGKTVALKTVGLLSLMAQCGLHIPAEQGSVFSMHSNILCDIGDGQSIAENLSTFSAHITNIVDILENVTEESLVLLDELGSGTDPAEGMGIAVAILEELRQKGCLFVATTHYPEIKDFARNTERLINARMEFDRESLKPLFKLQIGEAGESCALYIAQRLGFPNHMLRRAHSEAYGTEGFAQSDAPQRENRPLAAKIQKEAPKRALPQENIGFAMGDSVMVYPQKEIAIVYKPADEKGDLTVQIKGEKQKINHKRITLITPAAELYPENYDFSIVFDSVENRKARHQIDKGHRPGVVVRCDE